MIHSYKFKNFFSYEDEAEVSFLQRDKSAANESLSVCKTGQCISKVIAVLGSNGSGKTGLLKPLSFISWFLRDSFRHAPDKDIPIGTHFFSKSKECEMEIVFDFNERLWKYTVILTKERVIKESMYSKGIDSRTYSYVFVREYSKANASYAYKQKGFGFTKKQADKVRPGASVISTAAQFNNELALILTTRVIFTNISSSGYRKFEVDHVFGAARFYYNNPDLAERVTDILTGLDLGLSDIKINKRVIENPESDKSIEVYLPMGIHKSIDGVAQISFHEESSGTQSAYVLLSALLPALEIGGVAVIDEMESDLHPHMLQPILDLFVSKETNPLNAQLIFTSHTAEILHSLDKSQVMLIEKDEACRSHAWRLDEMKGIRNDDNIYAKYMAGAYGAVPYL